MTREGYANLSVPADRLDEFRRRLETLNLDTSQAQYAMNVLETSISKLEFIQKNLSHISFSGIGKNGMALFDEKTDELLRVYTKGSKLFCSVHKEKPCEHKIFAALHPDFEC